SSHVGESAGAQGFEPCAATLEIACSPRSTLLSIKGARRESNPHPLVHSQPCRNRYTTGPDFGLQIEDCRFEIVRMKACGTSQIFNLQSSSPGWTRTTGLSHVKGTSWPLNDGTRSEG